MPAFQTVTATAPGKLILMGEHSAVYGRPAIVAALGLYTRATIRLDSSTEAADSESPPVGWDLPDLEIASGADWAALRAEAARFRRAWERQMNDAESRELERMRRRDPARVVKLALAESLGESAPPGAGVSVRVRSDLPVGAGLGSSASVAVAVAAALRVLLDGALDPVGLEPIALEVERREHGRPSGIDHATVLHGGIQWMEPTAGGLSRRPLVGAGASWDGWTAFDTGRPEETTGEMVEAVRRRFVGRGARLEAILDGMESDVRQLGAWLENGEGDRRAPLELLRRFERRLEALGVVPEPIRELVRRIEGAGGAAKISGAGALRGPAAGSLLVYHPERPPRSLSCLARLRPLEADLGVAGVEVEQTA